MKNLKANERELLKLINFFRKRAEKLILTGELNPEEQQVTQACQNLANTLNQHAAMRAAIMEKREKLANIVKDQAKCPKCQSNSHLKYTGVAYSEQGWKSNKYKCRRCNIGFTWNRPNNPWDLVPYLREVIAELEETMEDQEQAAEIREQAAFNRDQMLENLARLEPVLQESDEEMAGLEAREKEMGRMIHEFKNYLLIEKIKMDTWQETV